MSPQIGDSRYSRQIALPEIGPEGQARIRRASVLCVGVGGLGSPAALYLAAAGVGRIGLLDPDRIDPSNLQRQVLFAESETGELKVGAAARRLASLNPGIELEAMDRALTADNALELFSRYELIIDGTDSFAAKFLICDAAARLSKPCVYAAVNGFEGQVALFRPDRGSCYRCLHPRPPETRIANCAEAGVLGALAGVIGSHQALLAIQYLASGGDRAHPAAPPEGRLLVLDALGLRSRAIEIPRRPGCAACGVAPETITLASEPQARACGLPSDAVELDAHEVRALAPEGLLFVDVREQWERSRYGVIDGDVSWPLSRLHSGEYPGAELIAGRTAILYCKAGMRSLHARELLLERYPSLRRDGTRLVSLAGGYLGWERTTAPQSGQPSGCVTTASPEAP